jgi:hypothetical protein
MRAYRTGPPMATGAPEPLSRSPARTRWSVVSVWEAWARCIALVQVLASLNHPHIAAIYGVEESDGVR